MIPLGKKTTLSKVGRGNGCFGCGPILSLVSPKMSSDSEPRARGAIATW